MPFRSAASPMLLFSPFPVGSFSSFHSAYDLGPPTWRASSLSDQSNKRKRADPTIGPCGFLGGAGS